MASIVSRTLLFPSESHVLKRLGLYSETVISPQSKVSSFRVAHTWLPIDYISACAFAAEREKILRSLLMKDQSLGTSCLAKSQQ